MIRFATIAGLVLALGVTALADDKKEIPKELAPFQGQWKVVEASLAGAPAPKEEVDKMRFTFEGEKLTVGASGNDKTGSYSINSKKSPATIDMVSPRGEMIPGIYKFDKNGKLTLCFVKKPEAARPKDFDDKEATRIVLEKVKK